jgi:hypothetical protein
MIMVLAVIAGWAVFLRPKFPAIREKYRREQEQNQERQSSAALSQVGNVVLLDPKDAISAREAVRVLFHHLHTLAWNLLAATTKYFRLYLLCQLLLLPPCLHLNSERMLKFPLASTPPSPPQPPQISIIPPAAVRPARAHVVYPTLPPAHLPGGTLGVIGGAQTSPHPAQRSLHPPRPRAPSGRNPGAPGLSAKDGIACATAPQKAASGRKPPPCPPPRCLSSAPSQRPRWPPPSAGRKPRRGM